MIDDVIDVTVERTLDVGLCLEILTNKVIFDSISEDGANVEHLNIDVINNYWCGIYDGKTEIGVIQFKPMFHKCFDAHIHILPKHRLKYTELAGVKIWEWIRANLPGSLIVTHVPSYCESVKKFLIKCGFEQVGHLEKAWLKDGEQNDMVIFSRRSE